MEQLQKKTEEDVKKSIEAAVKKSQEELKADYFGFGEEWRRTDKHDWKKVKNNWNETFVHIPIDVHVDIKIWHTGTIGNSPLSQIKD